MLKSGGAKILSKVSSLPEAVWCSGEQRAARLALEVRLGRSLLGQMNGRELRNNMGGSPLALGDSLWRLLESMMSRKEEKTIEERLRSGEEEEGGSSK